MSKRFYVVVGPTVDGAPITERLVNATTQGTAIAHAAKGHFAAKIAKTADVARLMAAGVKPEEAGESVE